jgi:hypothetical protein
VCYSLTSAVSLKNVSQKWVRACVRSWDDECTARCCCLVLVSCSVRASACGMHRTLPLPRARLLLRARSACGMRHGAAVWMDGWPDVDQTSLCGFSLWCLARCSRASQARVVALLARVSLSCGCAFADHLRLYARFAKYPVDVWTGRSLSW